MEEAASWIDCQETKLDKALEKIIEKEKAATDARSLQDDNKKTAYFIHQSVGFSNVVVTESFTVKKC